MYINETSYGETGEELQVLMGLSIGWGDEYPYYLSDQYVDITGLPNGKYRLKVTADYKGEFVESDDSNNFTWVDISLRNGRVSVLAYGPSA